MRSSVGHVSSSQFDEYVKASKLNELSKRKMTAKEMNLHRNVIQTLKSHEVIVKVGERRENRRQRPYIVWGPGPKYTKTMKKWGWA